MCAKKKKCRRFTIETVGGEVLLNMTAMAAKRELCYEFCAFNVVVSTGSRRFSTKNKVQSNTQSCVSSVSVTCMRRTCIVLMRTVIAKKKKLDETSENNLHNLNNLNNPKPKFMTREE